MSLADGHMPHEAQQLKYSDGIAAARTLVALEANGNALQRRLPGDWELAPYSGDDLRGKMFRGANLLLPFHEIFAVRSNGPAPGVPQVSYLVFISQARHRSTGALGHIHWLSYTEDGAGVPGKYADAKLADIARTQTFSKERRGETIVSETFSATTPDGEVRLALTYRQGGLVTWVTADKPNLPLYAARDPNIVRWYQEDQVIDVVRSVPMGINTVSSIDLVANGELADVFDGNQRIVGVAIQRPYLRHVYVP